MNLPVGQFDLSCVLVRSLLLVQLYLKVVVVAHKFELAAAAAVVAAAAATS